MQRGRTLALSRWVNIQIQLTAQPCKRDAALGLYGGFRSRAGRSITIDEGEAVLGQGFAAFATTIPAFRRQREQADVVGF
jgi:hypothetical protein